MFQEYYQNFKSVDNLMEIVNNHDFLKIAVYHSESSEEFIYPAVKNLDNNLLIKVSGKNWLDISDKKANKGDTLKKVQQLLQVTKQETMVFGDYHNDLEMLQEADFSFAMKNAHKDILKAANYATESNDNFGVEVILQKLLDAKK